MNVLGDMTMKKKTTNMKDSIEELDFGSKLIIALKDKNKNVYRTPNFIVIQILSKLWDEYKRPTMRCDDNYYPMTKAREGVFKLLMGNEEGERIRVELHKKHYRYA